MYCSIYCPIYCPIQTNKKTVGGEVRPKGSPNGSTTVVDANHSKQWPARMKIHAVIPLRHLRTRQLAWFKRPCHVQKDIVHQSSLR